MDILLGKVQILTLLVFFGICSEAYVPANFVFGDSLVEAGNNNYIVSLSKADYFPNRIDLGKSTGRYTNGKTIADIIGQAIGFKEFTPPYLAPTTIGPVVLLGVNYASGGGGIQNHTGNIFGGRINMDAQLDNFANTREEIISRVGAYEAMQLFEKALFPVTIGSNDFINNYLTPVVSTLEQKLVSPQMFVVDMISRYTLQLTELVVDLNAHLKGGKFVYADVYHIVDDIIQNQLSYGFENANSACCYVGGKFGGLIPCGPTSKVYQDRSKYVFWDPYHPSEAANQIIAKRLMDGYSDDILPINVQHLIEL